MAINLSKAQKIPEANWLLLNSNLSFSQYIDHCRTLILEKRKDLLSEEKKDVILNANSPFELFPVQSIPKKSLTNGVLLIHGLLDSPFTLKEIACHLQAQGVLCRSVLLPGHGTIPGDLNHVSAQNWIETVAYGVRSLQSQVDKIFLVGYSTGAALAIYHALQDPSLAGIVLLAPAIKIKAPVEIVGSLNRLMKLLRREHAWLHRSEELDYAKYSSLPLHPVLEVHTLCQHITQLAEKTSLSCPMMMAVSSQDETISSSSAVDFFTATHDTRNKLILYTSKPHKHDDTRIYSRKVQHPQNLIQHASHISLPFSENNSHYGKQGDYINASQMAADSLYGAYNRIQVQYYNWLYQMRLLKLKRRQLTYNPDFDFLMHQIETFILE